MEKRQLESFIDLIGRRTGLSFAGADHQGLARKLQSRMAAGRYREPEAYLELLTQEIPESAAEWLELAAVLTTGESYFFRDRGQFDLLRRRLLPELIAARQGSRRLRIWSAGCSTGEEAYSLAILIRELLPALHQWQVLIQGTDLNEQALAKARRGRYSAWSFRGVDPALQQRYFSPQGEEWLLNDEIRRMVVFERGNLVTDRFPDAGGSLHNLDLILCRNTFIYFSPRTIAKVVAKFADTLADDGTLVTGHGELQLQGQMRFQLRFLDDQVIYRKRSAEESPPVLKGSPAERPLRAPVARRPAPKEPLRANPPPRPPAEPRPVASAALLAEAHRALDRGEPEQAISRAQGVVATDPGNLFALKVLARAYADRGDYQRAGQYCLRALEGATTDPDLHFLLAQVAEAAGDLATAREALEKTLYLEPGRVAALIELGNLCHCTGQTRKGATLFQVARARLENLPREAEVPDFPELTAGELVRHLDDLLNPPGLQR